MNSLWHGVIVRIKKMKERSDCHNAPVTIIDIDHGRWGITHDYICLKCKEYCNLKEEDE